MQGYQFLPMLSCNFCTHYLGVQELLLLKTTTPVWNLPKDFLIMIPIYLELYMQTGTLIAVKS
jgi:hypothetical protein